MRAKIIAVFGATALMACGGTNEGGAKRGAPNGGGTASTDDPSSTTSGPATPSGPTCPAELGAPKTIGVEPSADDIHILGDKVFYRAVTKVFRASLTTSARDEIYSSPDLGGAFVDQTSLLTIESPAGDPNATLKIISLDGSAATGTPTDKDPGGVLPPGTDGIATATNLNATSTYAFGSDAAAFYLVSDSANGDVIYSFDRATLQVTEIANTGGVVSDAQMTSGAIWYVKDQMRVFKIDLSYTDPSDPTLGQTPLPPAEMFGIGYDTCNLAIGLTKAYCSTKAQIEQRELSGANPKTLLEMDKSKIHSPFGTARSSGDNVIVHTLTGDPVFKSVLRNVAVTGDEHLVACGRDAIGALAVDGANVVWAEAGKGVFSAPR